MKTIYVAQHIIDAQLVRDALDADGIPAYVAGAFLTGGLGELPVNDIVRVMVADHYEAQARAVVERIERELVESRAVLTDDGGNPGLEPA